MEDAILISVSKLTSIIQDAVRNEITSFINVMGDKQITAREAAGILGVSIRTLARWQKEHPELKYYLVGRSIRYSLFEVNKFKRLINK